MTLGELKEQVARSKDTGEQPVGTKQIMKKSYVKEEVMVKMMQGQDFVKESMYEHQKKKLID